MPDTITLNAKKTSVHGIKLSTEVNQTGVIYRETIFMNLSDFVIEIPQRAGAVVSYVLPQVEHT